jgi:hypothetical protein
MWLGRAGWPDLGEPQMPGPDLGLGLHPADSEEAVEISREGRLVFSWEAVGPGVELTKGRTGLILNTTLSSTSAWCSAKPNGYSLIPNTVLWLQLFPSPFHPRKFVYTLSA